MKSTKLTRSNKAGWLMSLPGFGLIFCFIVLPFLFALGLSLTNQRLISPNPTEFVGLSNYSQLLAFGMLTLEPERNENNEIVRDDDGQPEYPRIRSLTRGNPDYEHLSGMREWYSWQSGDNRKVILARDVVFMTALLNTFLFVLIVAPVQGALALGLALLINQQLRGINIFQNHLFHASGGFHCCSVAALAIHLRRQRWTIEQFTVHAILRIIHTRRLVGKSGYGTGLHHGHVDLASRWLSHGYLAGWTANHLTDAL